jgi:hypothetical protein
MKLIKLDDRYTFTEEGDNNYTLELGNIKQYEDTTVTFRVEEVDASNFYLKATCGCTVADIKIIDPTTLILAVRYKDCDASFAKVLEIRETASKVLTGLFKIVGQCQSNNI